MPAQPHSSPDVHLGGMRLDDTRIRLLEAIDVHGSITRAAKALPMSYKAAWDAIDAMNNLSEQALVERQTGGRQGGGSRLTAHGRHLVAMYRAMQGQQRDAFAQLQQSPTPGEVDAAGLRRTLRRLSVRSSARNQFVGTVRELRTGPVSAEVLVELDTHTTLVAGVTRESADALALAPGASVLALVKASSVLLSTDTRVRTSARNHLTGTVARVLDGGIGAEVTLDLPVGRTVTASITHESVVRLGLAEGMVASALFKASSVILVALD